MIHARGRSTNFRALIMASAGVVLTEDGHVSLCFFLDPTGSWKSLWRGAAVPDHVRLSWSLGHWIPMDYPDQRCIRSIERHAMSFSPRPRLESLKQKARDEMGVERYEVWPPLFVHTLHPSIHPSLHPSIRPSIHPSIHPSTKSCYCCCCCWKYRPSIWNCICEIRSIGWRIGFSEGVR